MVRIRLKRMGTKGRPYYRIVAAPSTAARDGQFVEQLGTYDPLVDPPAVTLSRERALHWLLNGAQVSEVVERLFKREGVWQEFEQQKPAKKAKRKPVKPRVKEEKPVKPRKRKPRPEPEPEAGASEGAQGEAQATEAAAESASE